MVGWLRLFAAKDQVVELRALEVVSPTYRTPHTVSGFFDYEHLKEMAWKALELTESARGVYFTLNPLQRDLLSRCYNRADEAPNNAATDKDVLRYCWLLLDVDPQRISGVSATDAEKAKALQKILEMHDHLRQQQWPEPIRADSGNGYHLLYRIDLQTTDAELVKRVLHALAEKFDDEHVKVDRSVFNPSRITKLYGTKARKGDDTPERPHRDTCILAVPEMLQVVPRSHLEALAALASSTRDRTTKSASLAPRTGRGKVQERARAYLEQLPPAVSGNHGHDRAFHAACTLVLGFALPVEEALPILQQYNQRCQPLWKEEELLHKLQDADKKETQRGYLLGKTQRIVERSDSSCFAADFLDCETLQRTARKPRWLVKHILVAGQPAEFPDDPFFR